MRGEWAGTGRYEQIDRPSEINRIPPYDPRSGDHCWVITTAHRVDPSQFSMRNPPILDRETLMIVAGPGCFYCEQPYTPKLAVRRCKGEPR